MYKVSVIITTYNLKSFLERSIKSVISQNYNNLELLIIDDGSTDNSKKLVEQFIEKDSRIKYFYQENKGQSSAINLGIKKSTGDIISILDCDDEYLPDKLEKTIKILEKYHNIDFILSYAYRVFEDGKIKKFKNFYKNILLKKDWIKLWENFGIISLSTISFRKKLIDKIGFFDEKLKFAADVDFYMRAIKETDFYFIPDFLVKYYEREGSSSKKFSNYIPDFEYILEKYFNVFNEYPKSSVFVLKSLGTCYLLNGDFKKSTAYFLKAIKANPYKLRLYFQFLISLFPWLYKKILFLKKKFF